MRPHSKRGEFFLSILLSLCLFSSLLLMGEVFGPIEKGLFRLEEKRASYYLYVPQIFEGEGFWPLVVLVPSFGTSSKKFLEAWIPEAEARGYFILAPSLKKPESLPEVIDRWILNVIGKVSRRYQIDRNRILLVGVGEGANYVTYLALRYPHRFQAAASLGGGLKREYQRLIQWDRVKGSRLSLFAFGSEARGSQAGFVSDSLKNLEAKGVEVYRENRLGDFNPLSPDYSPLILDWYENVVLSKR